MIDLNEISKLQLIAFEKIWALSPIPSVPSRIENLIFKSPDFPEDPV